MFVVLSPYEHITKSFSPSLKPTATLKVKGCASRLVGLSVKLKVHSQASILSKLVEEMCSYLIALIFFSADSIKKSFFVGIKQTSRIFCIRSVEVRTDWIGDRSVSTSVSWSSKLKTTGNSLPGGSLWFWGFCLIVFISPFSLRYYDWIGIERSYLSFSFTWTTTQIAIVYWAKVIFEILCRKGQEKLIF